MPDVTVSADVDSMLRSANDAAIRSAIGVGTTDAPTFLAQTLTGQSLTGTQATSLVDLAATWNTTGNPSLIYGRVTNTNSGTTANLIDLGTFAGGSLFKVDKTGTVTAIGLLANSSDISTGFFGSSVRLNSNAAFLGFGSPSSVFLYRDADGILAQRNGTAKQALRVYNTALSGAPEWAEFDWITSGIGNTLRIGTNLSGTGVARPIDFVTGGVVRMSILAGGGLDVTGDLRGGATVRCGAASGIGVEGRFFIKSPADGIGTLVDWAQSNFNRLQLGGTTDAFPAIARDGAGIKFTGAAAGSTSWVKVPAVAVSALPSAATAGVGARSFVNDALTPFFGSAVAGGGAVTVPVYSTGSAWNVG